MISRSYTLRRPRRQGSEFSETESCRIPFSNSLSLQIYSDSRPRNSKTADIQKGLIIVYDRIERVGEGTGFGVPIVQFSDETYFSGSASVHTLLKQDGATIIKSFVMNMVRRKKLGEIKIENRVMRDVFERFAEVYQKHSRLRLLMLADLFQRLGMRSDFVKAEPVGHIIVTYHIGHQGSVKVKANFSFVKKENLQKIFLLNEQSSTFFKKYRDSNGTVLFDKQVGAWERVEAKWATISEPKTEVGFRLWKIKASILRRGREFLKGHLDWIGLDYEIGPDKATFEYNIEILGAWTQR